MENEIIIRPEEIKILAKEGEKFVFTPKAEESLTKLIEMYDFLGQVIEQVKAQIAMSGVSINPNFKGAIGDRVRCMYRYYGAKYNYEFSKKDIVMPFLKEKVTYSVDSDKVDKYVKDNGSLPDGITEAEREKQLSISLKNEEPEKQLLE